MTRRSVYLSEVAQEILNYIEKNGDSELSSIGTGSGANGCFEFYCKGHSGLSQMHGDINVKINRLNQPSESSIEKPL